MRNGRIPRAIPLGLVALGIAVLLPRLGDPMVIHADEGHYVGAALGALDHDDWVVPRVEGEFNRSYGKPPLGYLAMAASVTLLGRNKFALRLPFALAGLILLVLVWGLSEDLRPGAGLLAAGLLLASPGWAENIRRIWLESLVCAFDLGAILLYARLRRRGAWVAPLTAGGLIALSLLTKQVAGGFALGALVLAELLDRRRDLRRVAIMVFVASVPTLIWGWLLYQRVGPEAESVWSFHVAKGVLEGHRHQPRQPWDWWFGIVALIGWTGAIAGTLGLGGLVASTRGDRSTAFLRRTLLLYLVGVMLVVGVISKSFRFWYPFPAGYVLVIAAGVGGVLAWRALLTRVPRVAWMSLAGAAVALAVGYGLSFRNNVTAIPEDPLLAMTDAIRDAGIDAVVAEPRFFREEFTLYFQGLPLRRVPRGRTCVPKAPGERLAYAALDRRPHCWPTTGGRGGRITHHYYWIDGAR